MNKGCDYLWYKEEILPVTFDVCCWLYYQKKRASMNNTLKTHWELHLLEESDESIIYLIYSKEHEEGLENK